MGHLIPVLELAKRLSSLHSFKITIMFVSTHADYQVQPSIDDVDLLEIPSADISSIVDPGAQLVTKIGVLMRETGPVVRAAISGLTAPKPTVLIFDMFATEYVSIGRDLGLPSFVYVPSSAWFLALTIRCPVLDKEVQGEYVDQTEPFHIPGCKPVRPDEVVDPMLQRTDPQYKEYLRMGVEIPLFDGVLSNTWRDLEGSTLAALSDEGKIIRVPVYEIGPIVRTVDVVDEGNELLEWLDRQPAHSVMYISFGSGGTLSKEQMTELAWGLELSQQRFVWVVRPPPSTDGEASGSYFGLKGDLDNSNNMGKYLPQGFIERARARDSGLFVPQWAPQLKILSHRSVGGFLTHCGWNSILESLTMGVPMIAWPMYAEQRMNAAMLVEELEVAIRPCQLPVKKVVRREEIDKMVRRILEGDEGRCMRLKAQDLQTTAAQALNVDGGSSYKSLSKFVHTL